MYKGQAAENNKRAKKKTNKKTKQILNVNVSVLSNNRCIVCISAAAWLWVCGMLLKTVSFFFDTNR